MCDAKQIGQGRQYADPEDAMRATYGSYVDAARLVTPESKLPCGPRAAPPAVFSTLRRATGGSGTPPF